VSILVNILFIWINPAVKASIECSIANISLWKSDWKIDEIDFWILANIEERDLYLNYFLFN